jgi:hypothetical protein
VVDWSRTERYTASARYQHYADTRAEEDFARLSGEVARVLNEVAIGADRAKALKMAEQARRTLADWPQAHYGYRQKDVREIVSLLDEAISDLRAAAGVAAFDLAFVAMAPEVPLEPVFGMPPKREMFDQLLKVAALADRSAERVVLLQSALSLLDETGGGIPASDITSLRASVSARIREEIAVDEQYARVSQRLLANATRAAARARVRDLEAILARVGHEDDRLGRKRPEVVQALNASVRAQLEAARKLRLLRDQWMLRRSLYRDYEHSVGAQILQLVKSQPALDAIKRLEGPPPDMLRALRARLEGGAERLQRVQAPEDLRAVHDLLVGAWQFAANAARTRHDAITTGNLKTAWEASSSAAGALMLLSRAQNELRTFLEPPRLR